MMLDLPYGQDGTAKKTPEMQGTSKRHVGEVMKTRRNEVYLATQTHDRTYDGSMRLLEKSLKNLQTDHIDLWQIHNIKGQGKDICRQRRAESLAEGPG